MPFQQSQEMTKELKCLPVVNTPNKHTHPTHTHTHTSWLANWSHLQLCKERAISILHDCKAGSFKYMGHLTFAHYSALEDSETHSKRWQGTCNANIWVHSKPDLYTWTSTLLFPYIRAHFCQLWASALLPLLQLQHGKHVTALQNLWEDTGVQHEQQVVLGWVPHFVFCTEVRKPAECLCRGFVSQTICSCGFLLRCHIFLVTSQVSSPAWKPLELFAWLIMSAKYLQT